MLKFIITDENFNQIESHQKSTPMGIVTKLRKHKNSISITVNTMAPFAIYKWEQAGHFAISNKLNEIAGYIANFGCELTYAPTVSKYYRMQTFVDRVRDCANVEKITRWNTVVINREGAIKITKYPKQPFTIPLTTRRGVNVLLKWLKKYLIIAKLEIENNHFIPTLTGGMDTRALTWFWRDLYHGSDYYLKAVKPDGRNNVVRGQIEVEIATQVLKRLGQSLERKEEKYQRLTFSGVFTDNGIMRWRKSLNDPDFIYDFIALHFSERKIYFNSRFVCPFVDNLYLQLKHPVENYMRTLLMLLLCPDLLDIAVSTYDDQPTYVLGEKFAGVISGGGGRRVYA